MTTPDVPTSQFLNDVLQTIDSEPCGCGDRRPHGHLTQKEIVLREDILAAMDRDAARRAARHLEG